MADVRANSIWHVIPEPPTTLQSAATWRIQCRDPRAMCHITACCHRANSTACHPRATARITLQGAATWWIHCHVENRFSLYFIYFLFFIQFRLWRAAAFVSSPIHLFVCLSPRPCSGRQPRSTCHHHHYPVSRMFPAPWQITWRPQTCATC